MPSVTAASFAFALCFLHRNFSRDAGEVGYLMDLFASDFAPLPMR